MINTNQEWVTTKDAPAASEKGYYQEVELIQPWSVPVFKTTLPPKILQIMIEISDRLLADTETEPYGTELIGEINTELYIDPNILQQEEVMGFFLECISRFVMLCKCQQGPQEEMATQSISNELWMTELVRMWIVSQQPGEYNPIHIHGNCKISGVMYLKVPKMLKCRKKSFLPHFNDGCITFVGNPSQDVDFCAPNITFPPEVGDFYIFGANQQHSVYPFRCEEGDPERRSVAFNATYQSKTEFDYNLEILEPVENLLKENKLEEAYEKINSSSLDAARKGRIIANIKREKQRGAIGRVIE